MILRFTGFIIKTLHMHKRNNLSRNAAFGLRITRATFRKIDMVEIPHSATAKIHIAYTHTSSRTK